MEDAIQRSSRAVQNDDERNAATNPVLLKPWCFLEKGGLKEPGGKLRVLFILKFEAKQI